MIMTTHDQLPFDCILLTYGSEENCLFAWDTYSLREAPNSVLRRSIHIRLSVPVSGRERATRERVSAPPVSAPLMGNVHYPIVAPCTFSQCFKLFSTALHSVLPLLVCIKTESDRGLRLGIGLGLGSVSVSFSIAVQTLPPPCYSGQQNHARFTLHLMREDVGKVRGRNVGVSVFKSEVSC